MGLLLMVKLDTLLMGSNLDTLLMRDLDTLLMWDLDMLLVRNLDTLLAVQLSKQWEIRMVAARLSSPRIFLIVSILPH